MKKTLILSSVLLLLLSTDARAANLAVITSTPTIWHLLVLGVAVACIALAFKVLMLVRGGLLSRSWQFFLGGFAALVLAQLILILDAIEVIVLPGFVVPICFIVMTGLFLWGVLETKRTLG